MQYKSFVQQGSAFVGNRVMELVSALVILVFSLTPALASQEDPYSYEAISNKDYSGITLNALTRLYMPSSYGTISYRFW